MNYTEFQEQKKNSEILESVNRTTDNDSNIIQRPFCNYPMTIQQTDNRITVELTGSYLAKDGKFYDMPAGRAEAIKQNGEWIGTLVQTDQDHFKNSKAGLEALRQIVLQVGPIKTSKMFSPSGKKLMNNLVKYHYADELDHGDYLIHFKHPTSTSTTKK